MFSNRFLASYIHFAVAVCSILVCQSAPATNGHRSASEFLLSQPENGIITLEYSPNKVLYDTSQWYGGSISVHNVPTFRQQANMFLIKTGHDVMAIFDGPDNTAQFVISSSEQKYSCATNEWEFSGLAFTTFDNRIIVHHYADVSCEQTLASVTDLQILNTAMDSI